MTRLWAIASREFRSMFRLPVGWIAIALYLFLTGVIFSERVLIVGEPATLRYFFAVSGFLLLPVVPAVSMRLISEELRSGTIEALMTAPVGDASVVLGKYLGAAMFLVAMLVPTLVYVAILRFVSDPAPDAGPIVAGYLALLLLGLFYLAVGTLASALTANQTLAFMLTLLTLLTIVVVTGEAAASFPEPLNRLLPALSINQRMQDFSKGVIDTSHIVFFLSVSAWFLSLAIVAVQSRRWR